MKVLELFAGIGACSKALTNLGVEHEIVDAVEIDKFAMKAFNAIHGTNFEPQDITKWDKDIECDLIMHGSPCQDFSVAGKQAGGDKDSGTRSSLMYETLRIVEKLKPKYVIWENVKNLLSKKHRHNFDAYLEAMERLGYKNYYQVLNAKDYGIPQNRERVFTVSILDGGTFKFPETIPLEKKLKDVLEENVDEKYYISKAMMDYFMGVNQKPSKFPRKERFLANINRKAQDRANSITTNPGQRPTDNFVKEPFIVASRGRNPENPSDRVVGAPTEQRLEPKFDGTTNTITTVQKDNYVATPYRIRKLTPKECYRLMGFDDIDYEKASKVISNTQLYKTAGNSIVVNVLQAILINLLEEKMANPDNSIPASDPRGHKLTVEEQSSYIKDGELIERDEEVGDGVLLWADFKEGYVHANCAEYYNCPISFDDFIKFAEFIKKERKDGAK